MLYTELVSRGHFWSLIPLLYPTFSFDIHSLWQFQSLLLCSGKIKAFFFLGFVSSHLILHGSQGFGGGDWGELVNHKTLPRVGSFPAFDHSWAPLKFLPQPFAAKFVSTETWLLQAVTSLLRCRTVLTMAVQLNKKSREFSLAA